MDIFASKTSENDLVFIKSNSFGLIIKNYSLSINENLEIIGYSTVYFY